MVVPPTEPLAPWQVLVAVMVLVAVLVAAVALAQVSVLAVSGLVPVLAAARKLIPSILLGAGHSGGGKR
jgi:hypothetical protein